MPQKLRRISITKNQVYLIKKSYVPVIIPFLLSLFPISYSKRQTPNTPLVYGDML